MQAGVEKAIRQVHSEAQQSGLPFFRSRFQASASIDATSSKKQAPGLIDKWKRLVAHRDKQGAANEGKRTWHSLVAGVKAGLGTAANFIPTVVSRRAECRPEVCHPTSPPTPAFAQPPNLISTNCGRSGCD